jgi:outer membrane lipoprotein LolB
MKNIILLVCALLLTSCAIAPPAPTRTIPWATRQTQLSRLASFHLKGAMAVKRADKGFSASLDWQQTANHFRVRMYGPLGAGQIIISGGPGKVELRNAKKERFLAQDINTLVYQQTGWHLPIADLLYWVRGIPVGNLPKQQTLDQYQRLATLKQQGWLVQYLQYQARGPVDLPRRLVLTKGDMKLKLVLTSWKF